MVLIRVLTLALLVSGCGRSLFDNGPGGSGDDGPPGDGGGSADSPPVQTSCEAPCLGDASGNFDGTPAGSNGHWRYLDDTRNRAWTPMTGTTSKTGAGSNAISSCAANASAAACAALPGALLFTSTGASSGADPAIELTVADAKVAQISLLLHVPTGGREQIFRLYRHSREDALFTGTAMPGTTLEYSTLVDALPGDRFLLTMAPMAAGTADVAVQMYVSDTQQLFPKNCQLAASFEPGTVTATTKLPNLCNPSSASDVLSSMNDEVAGADEPIAPTFAAGPFAEQGMAADFVEGRYFDTTVTADRTGDNTTQLWLKFDAFVTSLVFVVSDMDLDNDAAGGLSIDLYVDAGTHIETSSCNDGVNLTYTFGETIYQNQNAWHFIRASQSGGMMNVCVDGVRVFQYALAAGAAQSSYPIRIGRNGVWNPQEALLDGQIDDLRAFKGALPCE